MKNIFSFKLYLFGIKNLKSVGIITLCTTLFISIVYQWEKNFLTLFTVEYFAPLCMLAIASIPFFVHFAFSHFDFKQGENLFYGLPQKRFAYFTSFTFSIYTWIALIITSNCVAVTVTSLLSKWGSFYWGLITDSLISFLYYLLSAFLVTAIFVFAKSVSKGVYSWLVISGILLVFPIKFADVYVSRLMAETNTSTQFTAFGNLFDLFRSPLEMFPYSRSDVLQRVLLFAIETVTLTLLSFVFFYLKKTDFFKKTIVEFLGKGIFCTLALVPYLLPYCKNDITKSGFFSCLLLFTLALAIMLAGKISRKNLCVSVCALAVSLAVAVSLTLLVSPIAKRLDRIDYTADDIETVYISTPMDGIIYDSEFIGSFSLKTISDEAEKIVYTALTSDRGTQVTRKAHIILNDGREEYRILRLTKEEDEKLIPLCEYLY